MRAQADNTGWTALLFAACRGHELVVAELLAVRIRAQFGRIFELAECRRWLENALNFLRILFSVYLANLEIVKKRAEGGGQV